MASFIASISFLSANFIYQWMQDVSNYDVAINNTFLMGSAMLFITYYPAIFPVEMRVSESEKWHMKYEELEQYNQIAEAMAQDLREYADAAQEAGDSILVTESLLDEFDVVSNQLNGFGS